MGQNKFYTDLDSLLMPVHGAWCMVHARCRARRCEEGAIQLSTYLCSHTPCLYKELTRVWFDVTIDINTIILQ